MTRARTGALLLLIGLLAAVAALAVARSNRAAERPRLMLLTSLPLLFGEGFALQDSGSPALKALQGRFDIVPISVTSPAELKRGGLLLMAHPRAQPAEDLVALDEWVRRGGRLVLLADPLLEWPSARPLGDPLRPAAMFADTGLLAHWGLRLDSPEQRGPAVRKLAGRQVLTVSPGMLFGSCPISPDRFVAHCRIGRGQATVVADADLLGAERLGPAAAKNLDAVMDELAALEAR